MVKLCKVVWPMVTKPRFISRSKPVAFILLTKHQNLCSRLLWPVVIANLPISLPNTPTIPVLNLVSSQIYDINVELSTGGWSSSSWSQHIKPTCPLEIKTFILLTYGWGYTIPGTLQLGELYSCNGELASWIYSLPWITSMQAWMSWNRPILSIDTDSFHKLANKISSVWRQPHDWGENSFTWANANECPLSAYISQPDVEFCLC